jgi:hypothetical protein
MKHIEELVSNVLRDGKTMGYADGWLEAQAFALVAAQTYFAEGKDERAHALRDFARSLLAKADEKERQAEVASSRVKKLIDDLRQELEAA